MTYWCFIVGPSDTWMMSLPRVWPVRLFSQALAASAMRVDAVDEHLELAGIGQFDDARQHLGIRGARAAIGHAAANLRRRAGDLVGHAHDGHQHAAFAHHANGTIIGFRDSRC